MSLFNLMLRTLLSYLQKLAEQSLSLWGVPEDARMRLINVAENTTYLVDASQGNKAILRVRGENYHTLRAIESELAWLETLGRKKVIKTPGYFLGRNGRAIQFGNTDKLNNARLMVLFHFVDGGAPNKSEDMVYGFRELGAKAARCHDHAISWVKPTHFKQLTWDADAVFGPAATWATSAVRLWSIETLLRFWMRLKRPSVCVWRPLARRQSALTYFIPICGSQIRW